MRLLHSVYTAAMNDEIRTWNRKCTFLFIHVFFVSMKIGNLQKKKKKTLFDGRGEGFD